jgi:protein-S-isoprenylcysteine O-methyltransferase Ste14
MSLEHIALGLWLVFGTAWGLSAAWTGRATRRGGGFGEPAAYLIGYGIGFGLLFSGAARLSGGGVRLWTTPGVAAAALIGLELAAFAFAAWARLEIGRLWSGMLTLREGHHVVDTGPYGVVRHPIYTGFIAAAWALALIGGRPGALLGAATIALVMVVKSRSEERLLRRELGEADYDAYAARTPALIPFLRPFAGG